MTAAGGASESGRPRRVSNPPNPWASSHVEWLEEPPEARLEVYEEHCKSALSANDSPDVPFRYSLNPYRGCGHACAYCYARPSHQWLGFGAGTDFDTRLVVKVDVAEVLARELARPKWRREPVCLSGNTDPYQPLEAHYGLTRRCLEVLLERRTPAVVITKGALVRRDADLLAELAAGPGALVHISIPFADPLAARRLEPGAPSPAKRFEVLAALARAGVPVGVALAPVVPGLSETQVPEILARAAAAGARQAFLVPLRLPGEVAQVFEERLRAVYPERAARILSAQREWRGGALDDPRLGRRMAGQGARWEALKRLFELSCRRHGLAIPSPNEPGLPPGRPPEVRQGRLF